MHGALEAAVPAHYESATYAFATGLTIFADLTDDESLALYHEGAGATWSQATRWDDLLLEMAERR